MVLIILTMPEPIKAPELPSAEPLDIQDDSHKTITEDNRDSIFIIAQCVVNMLKIPNLVLCFILYLFMRTVIMSEMFFYQFASGKFDLPLSETPWFRSIKELSAILVLGLALPGITSLLHPYYSPQNIDLKVLKGGLLIKVIAFFAIYIASSDRFFAFTIFLCGAGEGIDPSMQGLASTFVVSEHRAMTFSILAMIDASGKIIGGPAMAALYLLRMDREGKSAGLCFLAAPAMFGTGLLVSAGVRLNGGAAT